MLKSFLYTTVVAIFVAPITASAQIAIKVDGSTGAMPLVAALANAYEAKSPGVKVEIGKGLGTKARIDALNAGASMWRSRATASKYDELIKAGMMRGRNRYARLWFRRKAGSVPVKNLSQAQVCAIYPGDYELECSRRS